MKQWDSSAFALPERLAAKSNPELIAADEQHFEAMARSLEQTIGDLSDRLDKQLKLDEGEGQEAMDRDMEVHRLNARLRMLRRFGLDLCLGHIVFASDPQPVYIGRLGLTDSQGRRLLVDWRSPAAEPFFAATHANPMGLSSRRRYRWSLGKISDYWDEVFAAEEFSGHVAALDDQSAFIASLGSTRSAKMRDVLSTIATDQDAIIRAGSSGALVVDGGPGTGKTVVALHRAAYLLYGDQRLARGDQLLFVGPHQPYLSYVADVLPSLGEEGVLTCTVQDLLPEGATAGIEQDLEVARLKSSADIVKAIEAAVKFYEEPPAQGMTVSTELTDIWLSAQDWKWAFEVPDPGSPHNEVRDQILDELVAILLDKVDDEMDEDGNIAPKDELRSQLLRNEELLNALSRAWPMIEPTDLVADLWSVPAYLRKCAPFLSPVEVRLLQRADAYSWTVSDLPLLDAARQRLGDSKAAAEKRQRIATLAAQRKEMDDVIGHLIASDDSEMLVMSMLRGDDLRNTLDSDDALPHREPDLLAGPFAHVIVDEAQELTDAQWQMLLLRCPTRSFTIVGDRAQARHGFVESWQERLQRVGFTDINQTSLNINYRTPEEIMTAAEPIIRAVLPDANVPTSIRSTGIPVAYGSVSELNTVIENWLADNADGVACIISMAGHELPISDRVRLLSPELVKGLEFDLVVLVDPDTFGAGVEGTVDRYVAMTRSTNHLVILQSVASDSGAD